MVISDNYGDLMAFLTTEEAIGYIEATDVLNDEYIFYNEDGDVLRAIVRDYQVLSFENTMVNKCEEIEIALRSWFRRGFKKKELKPSNDWIDHSSLSQLAIKMHELCL